MLYSIWQNYFGTILLRKRQKQKKDSGDAQGSFCQRQEGKSPLQPVKVQWASLTASCWRCLWCPPVWLHQAALLAHHRTSQSRSSGLAPRDSEPPLRGSAGWPGSRGWLGWCCRGWVEPVQGGTQGKRPTLTMRREEKRTNVDLHVRYMKGWKSHGWGGNVGNAGKATENHSVWEEGGGKRHVNKEKSNHFFSSTL